MNGLNDLRRRNPDAFRLAQLCAFAVRLEPHLLRALRRRFLPRSDPSAELDLWHSSLVQARGAQAAVLELTVLGRLRDLLTADPQRHEAYKTTLACFSGHPPLQRFEIGLNALPVLDPRVGDDAIEKHFAPLLATLLQGGGAAQRAARWMLQAAPRWHPRVRDTAAAWSSVLASSLLLGGRRLTTDELPQNLSLEKLGQALPFSFAKMHSIGVVITQDQLRFEPPESLAVETIELPNTSPALLLLTVEGQASRLVEVRVGEAVSVPGVTELLLHNLAGDAWRVESLQHKEPVSDVEPDTGLERAAEHPIGSIPFKRVFISSTTSDLWGYRKEAQAVLAELNNEFEGSFSLIKSAMDSEGLSGERETPAYVSRQWVRQSDWVVLIVAWNYGYQPPGESCSVTELEYREATRASNPPRECFVFLAGEDEDDQKAYRFNESLEEKDLISWNRIRPGADEWEKHVADAHKLLAFKNLLRSNKRFALFKNKPDFRQQLKDSLREAVKKEIQGRGGLTPGQEQDMRRALLIVLLGLQGPLKKCTDGVKLLANLKRIHDALHKIRQYGIRRWRDEVASSWAGGQPSDDALFAYVKGRSKVVGLQLFIEACLPHLPHDLNDLHATVKRVVEMEFIDDHQEALTDREKFVSDTNRFASRVQQAFTDTNKAMEQRARDLAQYHERFQQERLRASDGIAKVLSKADQILIDTESDALGEQQHTLQKVLKRHADWQHMHDLLERLDGTKGLHDPALFLDDLDSLIGRADKLGRLVADAETLVKADPSLRAREADIEAVRTQFEALRTQIEVFHTANDNAADHEALGRCYEAMRKAFDNLFFEVDRETLRYSEASERRLAEHARAIERLRESLSPRESLYETSLPQGMQ